MARKGGLDIEQGILVLLAEEERSMRELETRLNTNYASVRAHCRVLAFYGMIALVEHARSEANGRPYTTARITARGREIVSERRLAINAK